MPWFRVDDALNNHPKARAAGLEAMGLWTLCGAWSMQYLKEGFVPEWYVRTWPKGAKLAQVLVDSGLWLPQERDGTKGWLFHQWDQRQPSKKQVEAERDATRKRQQSFRDKRRDTPVSNGHSNGVTNGVSHGAPTQPIPLKAKDMRESSRFDEFWTVYPLKKAKKEAQAAYDKLVRRKVDQERIIAGAKVYAEYQRKPGAPATKYAQGWLNGERWEDEEPVTNHHEPTPVYEELPMVEAANLPW